MKHLLTFVANGIGWGSTSGSSVSSTEGTDPPVPAAGRSFR